MSRVLRHWLIEEGGLDYGIYYADDTYIPLNSDVPEFPRRPVEEPLSGDPQADLAPWAESFSLAKWPGYLAFGGDASWEGDGYLLLMREGNREMVWLLCPEQYEIFREVTVSDGVLIALSSEYPRSFRWTIPILEPWNLKVEKIPFQ
jgi:hypothetical protein